MSSLSYTVDCDEVIVTINNQFYTVLTDKSIWSIYKMTVYEFVSCLENVSKYSSYTFDIGEHLLSFQYGCSNYTLIISDNMIPTTESLLTRVAILERQIIILSNKIDRIVS